MKYYVVVRSVMSKGRQQAQFTVEPCTNGMSAADIRDALKILVDDMANMLIKDGIQPVIEISEASRNRERREKVCKRN